MAIDQDVKPAPRAAQAQPNVGQVMPAQGMAAVGSMTDAGAMPVIPPMGGDNFMETPMPDAAPVAASGRHAEADHRKPSPAQEDAQPAPTNSQSEADKKKAKEKEEQYKLLGALALMSLGGGAYANQRSRNQRNNRVRENIPEGQRRTMRGRLKGSLGFTSAEDMASLMRYEGQPHMQAKLFDGKLMKFGVAVEGLNLGTKALMAYSVSRAEGVLGNVEGDVARSNALSAAGHAIISNPLQTGLNIAGFFVPGANCASWLLNGGSMTDLLLAGAMDLSLLLGGPLGGIVGKMLGGSFKMAKGLSVANNVSRAGMVGLGGVGVYNSVATVKEFYDSPYGKIAIDAGRADIAGKNYTREQAMAHLDGKMLNDFVPPAVRDAYHHRVLDEPVQASVKLPEHTAAPQHAQLKTAAVAPASPSLSMSLSSGPKPPSADLINQG